MIRHLLLLILLLWPISSPAAIPVFLADEPTSHTPREVVDYWRLFYDGLAFWEGEIESQYVLATKRDYDALMRRIDENEKLVKAYDLENKIDAGGFPRESIADFLVAELVEHDIRYEVIPSDAQIQRVIDMNPRLVPRRDFVRGREILSVPAPGEDVTAVVEEITTKLESGEPFHIVAWEYYNSIGSAYEGRFGPTKRGQRADDWFRAFQEAPGVGEWFGPVRIGEGVLFGFVDERYSAERGPLEYLRKTLTNRMLSGRARRELQSLLESQKADSEWELFPWDAEKGESATAFVIDGEETTFQEARSAYPHLIHVPDSPTYSDDFAKRALEDALLRRARGEEIRGSEKFQRLMKAIRHEYLVQQHIRMKASEYSDTQLREMWRDTLGPRSIPWSQEFKVVTITMLVHSDGEDKYSRDHPVYRDMLSFRRKAEELLKENTKAVDALPALREAAPQGAEVQVREKWMSTADLGRNIGIAVVEIGKGQVSRVFRQGDEMGVSVLLDVRSAPIPEFSQTQADQALRSFLEESIRNGAR